MGGITMDIRELSIGSCVKAVLDNGETEATIYGFVSQITNEGVWLCKSSNKGDMMFDYSDIQPILLTDKLLKNIGFTHMGDSRFALTDAALLKYDAINYMFVTRYTHKLIKYLHQLQHELYDAGIELKIEL